MKNTNINILIFDLTGKIIDRLIEGYHYQGDYSIIWDAKHYSSGIYFIKMYGGNFIQTQVVTILS